MNTLEGLILTTRGWISIDTVQVGDEVIGWEDGEQIVQRVGQVGHFHGLNRTHSIKINDHYTFALDQSIFVWRDGEQYVIHASEIKKGDRLLRQDGSAMTVEKRYRIKHPRSPKDRVSLHLEPRSWYRRLWDRVRGVRFRFNRSYYLNGILVHNATRTAAAGGGNWSATGTWVEGSVPTAADDVFLTGASGNVTVDSGATRVCRSLDCNGYTGTLTRNATLDIGDGTAGAGNRALRLSVAMATTGSGSIRFASSSTTQQSVDCAGKTLAAVSFDGAGGSWLIAGSFNAATTATVTLTRGSVDLNGLAYSWGSFASSNSNTRTLNMTNANIAITSSSWNINHSNLSLTSTGSTITFTANGFVSINMAGGTYNTVIVEGSGQKNINGGNITSLTRTGSSNKSDQLVLATGSITLGTFTVNGNSAINRVIIQSGSVGSNCSVSASSVSMSNVDLRDITGTGSASWDLSGISGGSGDCGGNVGITFTPAQTQTWSGTFGGAWSTNAWTTRVPLPQDDVVIASAFSAGQTVAGDMPRLGKTIDWSGASGAPTWSINAGFAVEMYGSLTMIPGMTMSGNNALGFYGRGGSYTVTTAGRTFPSNALIFNHPTGTYSLQDAITSGSTFTHSNGTLITNGYTITCTTFTSNNTASTLTVNATTSLVLTSAGAVTLFTGNSGINAPNLNITVLNASSFLRTITGGGGTYGDFTANLAGSSGFLVFSGNNSWDDYACTDSTSAWDVQLTASTIQTLRGDFNVRGRPGALMGIRSTSATVPGRFSKASGVVSTDYLNIRVNQVQGGAIWHAGANSIDSGNNVNWIFSAPPAVYPQVVMF